MMRAFLLFTLWLSSLALTGAEPVVFVSSFAPGEKGGGIYAFGFDREKGVLTPLRRTAGVENPFFIALSPNQQFLYAIDAEKFGGQEDELVAAFAIEGRGGELRLLNRQSARGAGSCHVEVDPSGQTVIVANYTSGSVASLPLRSDGSLGEAVSVFQHAGPDPQKKPYAHCFVVSPDGRHALAADLGLEQVLIYSLDAAAARLAPHAAQPFAPLAPGSGPRHLAFHPAGNWVYVINENANTVTAFDWNASGVLKEKQSISTLPEDFAGKSHTADVKITPDGKNLYGTNRGHDSLACYRIAGDGTLTLAGMVPSGGKGPQNLLITPDGRWLLCANMTGNSVTVFRIDPATGSLTPQGEAVEVPMAACLRWME